MTEAAPLTDAGTALPGGAPELSAPLRRDTAILEVQNPKAPGGHLAWLYRHCNVNASTPFTANAHDCAAVFTIVLVHAPAQVIKGGRAHTVLGRMPKACSRRPQVSQRLPDLAAGGRTRVYVLGVSHVSRESVDAVRELVQAVRPEVVLLELCKDRLRLLLDPVRAWSVAASPCSVSLLPSL